MLSLLNRLELHRLPAIAPDRLRIDRAEALRYLQYRGQELPPELERALDAAAEDIRRTAEPRFVCRAFAFSGSRPVRLHGAELALHGEDIAELLQDAGACILLAAGLGSAVDRLISRAEIKDLGRALLLDSCASCAIESLCDTAQEQLAAACQSAGLYLTRRFSPGYGDLPLSCQRPLCAALDATRRIGLTVSQSGLLLPRKSVTAIIGVLAEKPAAGSAAERHDCSACSMAAACPYRKRRQTCPRD